jgi:hypothetical protein
MIGEGAIHRIGPHLNGLVGRGIGAVDGFVFSDIFLEAAALGEVWTENALDGFIANPDGYLPGTAMVFRGIRAAQDRADLIAYHCRRRCIGGSGRGYRSLAGGRGDPRDRRRRRLRPIPVVGMHVLPYRRGRRGHSVDPGPDADGLHRGYDGLPLR